MATANAPAGRLTRKGLATRARIVAAAAELMFLHGVAGTSNEDVLAAAHVSNSQLYHYFPDKNALVHAVIEHQADGIIDGQRPLLDQLDSLAAFRQWRDMLVDLQRQRHCEGGCPLGSLSSELAETDEPARTALAASFDRWEAPIRNGLRRMRDRGEFMTTPMSTASRWEPSPPCRVACCSPRPNAMPVPSKRHSTSRLA